MDEPARLVRTTDREVRADELSLALSSAGIDHARVRRDDGSWALLVDARDGDRATELLDAFERDEADTDAPPVEKGSPWVGVVAGALLLAFHAVTGDAGRGGRFFDAGENSARAVHHGEAWRAVTALTLHADWGHVGGNVAVLAILGAALGRRLGGGVAAWLVLLTGAVGNLLAALAARGNYFSIGASTATFGAVGALAALALVRRRQGREGRKAWMAPAAGLALLAMLGIGDPKDVVGPAVDVLAHGFGLVAGFALGFVFARRAAPVAPSTRDRIFGFFVGLAALAAVVACWAIALKA